MNEALAIREIEAVMSEALPLKAIAEANLIHEINSDLLEHASPNASQHVLARLPFDKHCVNAGLA
jgi:hypothetical protein